MIIKKSLHVLLSNGARLNTDMKDNNGFTALHYLVQEPELLEILISRGADVRAAEENSISLVTFLSSKQRIWRDIRRVSTSFYLMVHD